MPIKDPTEQSVRESSWQFLDEEECFRLWNETGNINKAWRILVDGGVRNPDTGEPPSRAGVNIAAMRYVIKNIEKSRLEIINAGGYWAEDRLKYLQWVVRRAQQTNMMGKRKRTEFNLDILSSAEDYLTPDEYEEFIPFYYRLTKAEPAVQEQLTDV